MKKFKVMKTREEMLQFAKGSFTESKPNVKQIPRVVVKPIERIMKIMVEPESPSLTKKQIYGKRKEVDKVRTDKQNSFSRNLRKTHHWNDVYGNYLRNKLRHIDMEKHGGSKAL